MSTHPEPTPTEDEGLGLAEIAPAEPPADFWEHAVSVAVDPSTPPVDDVDVPGDADLASDPDLAVDGDVPGTDGDDVDLSDFDDDPSAPDAIAADPEDTSDAAPGDDVNDIDTLGAEEDVVDPIDSPMDQPELGEPYPDSPDLGTVEQDEGAVDVDDPSAF